YTLRGVVVDDNTGALLPSVHVFLLGNQSRGVLTNERGEYQMLETIPAPEMMKAALQEMQRLRDQKKRKG
ncbi:MAG: carboxypeptidase-like regulatory domain-containing protein, partial [Bacteroidota bacterium]